MFVDLLLLGSVVVDTEPQDTKATDRALLGAAMDHASHRLDARYLALSIRMVARSRLELIEWMAVSWPLSCS